MKHAVAWLSHPSCRAHVMGAMHPEAPARLDAIEDRLRACGLGDFLWRVEAREATRDELLRVHTDDYLEALHAHGWSDEAIYDAVMVCALFNFYNRWIDANGVCGMPEAATRASGRRLAQGGYAPEE